MCRGHGRGMPLARRALFGAFSILLTTQPARSRDESRRCDWCPNPTRSSRPGGRCGVEFFNASFLDSLFEPFDGEQSLSPSLLHRMRQQRFGCHVERLVLARDDDGDGPWRVTRCGALKVKKRITIER